MSDQRDKELKEAFETAGRLQLPALRGFSFKEIEAGEIARFRLIRGLERHLVNADGFVTSELRRYDEALWWAYRAEWSVQHFLADFRESAEQVDKSSWRQIRVPRFTPAGGEMLIWTGF